MGDREDPAQETSASLGWRRGAAALAPPLAQLALVSAIALSAVVVYSLALTPSFQPAWIAIDLAVVAACVLTLRHLGPAVADDRVRVHRSSAVRISVPGRAYRDLPPRLALGMFAALCALVVAQIYLLPALDRLGFAPSSSVSTLKLALSGLETSVDFALLFLHFSFYAGRRLGDDSAPQSLPSPYLR